MKGGVSDQDFVSRLRRLIKDPNKTNRKNNDGNNSPVEEQKSRKNGIHATVHGVTMLPKSSLSSSLHGAKNTLSCSLHGAKSTLSSSLHGAKSSLSTSIHGNKNKELKLELRNLRSILNSYQDENEELLTDAQILLEENENINSDLLKLKHQNEKLMKQNKNLAEQLEKTQFELEESQLRWQEHIVVCSGTETSDRRLVNSKTSMIAPLVVSSTSGKRNRHSFPQANAFSNYQGSSESSGVSFTTDWSEQDLQLMVAGLQSEMARKSRAWEQERLLLEKQFQKDQNEMDALREVAQGALHGKQEDRKNLSRLHRIIQTCSSCSSTHERLVKQEAHQQNMILAMRNQQWDSSISFGDDDCGIKSEPRLNLKDGRKTTNTRHISDPSDLGAGLERLKLVQSRQNSIFNRSFQDDTSSVVSTAASLIQTGSQMLKSFGAVGDEFYFNTMHHQTTTQSSPYKSNLQDDESEVLYVDFPKRLSDNVVPYKIEDEPKTSHPGISKIISPCA